MLRQNVWHPTRSLNALPDNSGRPPTLLDHLKIARTKLLGSARFQRLAATFPLTQPIARANASALFDLCAGFVYSQVLLACVELGLLDALQKEACSLSDLSATTGLPEEGTDRLLKAAIALKLVEPRSAERYGLGPMGAALLGNPGVLKMIRHHPSLYEDLADPRALLQARSTSTRLASYWPYAGGDHATEADNHAVETYSALMSATQDFIADEVLSAYPFSKHRKLLDVGGGDGSFLRAVARQSPDLGLALIDLPPVTRIAADRFSAEGIQAELVGGDMFEDQWAGGADLISFVRVLHDHDDEDVAKLLVKARKSLVPGGSLLIAEPTADSPRAGDAYFGMYLWAMGSGRPRTIKEMKAMLKTAGFKQARALRTRQPLLVRVLIAS